MFDSIKEYLKPELIWFLVGLLLLLLEFAAPGLIVFFFGLGACIVAVVCLLTDITLNTQLIIFIVSSFLFLLILRLIGRRLGRQPADTPSVVFKNNQFALA